ncbi:hypothetical protein [Alteraurantiacibacter palmitatis]|uniref:RecA-like protein n=1 Tax=Alteraurantiacibacter palmitatis TaxID=2054628 RepID=A0ABV7E4J1_9SPHN
MDLSSLPTAAGLLAPAATAQRWQPGLGREGVRVLHSEIFAHGDDGAGVAAALALALDDLRYQQEAGAGGVAEEKPVLWVQDERSLKKTGRPYRPGLPPALRHRIIHVAARGAQDALFALEEGLRCRDLAFVIGEVAGNPRELGLTASRRLSLAAEKHGVPLFLVRHDAARDLGSARMRWQVRSAPSPRGCWNPAAPGAPSWHAELFRARAHPPGEWILRNDRETLVAERPAAAIQTAAPDHGDLVPAAGAGSLAAG